MTLVEQIELRYDNAINSIREQITAPPQSPQARYDYQKAIRKTGKPPKRYTAGLERMIHELQVEKRWMLKGILETTNYLLEHNIDVMEVIGDAEIALDKSTETNA